MRKAKKEKATVQRTGEDRKRWEVKEKVKYWKE